MTPDTEPSRTQTGYFLLVALIALIGIGKAVNTTLDPDCFWHLRVAEQLQRDGIGPLVDEISFASIKTPWTPYSWLAELGMKRLWDGLGYRATIIAQASAIVATSILIALACAELAGPQRRLNSVAATVLTAYLSLPYMSFRPATLALMLLALFGWLLLRDRRLCERSRAVWLIVPITVLLVNIHLTAAVVPISIACLLVGSFYERDRRSVTRYAVLLALTSAACLATPMLPGLIDTAWHYQFGDVMVASSVIAEMSPIYSGPGGLLTCAILLVLLAAAARNGRAVRTGEWIWFAVAALMMIRLGRFAPLFAVIAAPVMAATLPRLSDVVLERRSVNISLALVLAIGLAKQAWQFPRARVSLDVWLNRHGTDAFAYPTSAADYVERTLTPRTHRLVNEFNWGGYLAWRLRDYRVFVDGRTQLYEPSFWRRAYLSDAATLKALLASIDADAAVVPAQRSRFREALLSLGWTVAHQDEIAQVLLPPGH